MYISGNFNVAVRGRAADIVAGFRAVLAWGEEMNFSEMDVDEDAISGVSTLLDCAAVATELPEWVNGLEGKEREEQLEYFADEPWNRPDGEVMIYAPDNVEFDPFVMDGLAAMAAACPALEIAVLATLEYSVCGAAMYSFYSAAGASAFTPDHRGGDWFPLDEQGAGWENSLSEVSPEDIRLRFPEDADWIPDGMRFPCENEEDEDDEGDCEDD